MTKRMKETWDAPLIAAIGLSGTIALINSIGGLVIMSLTIFILAIRARKEYRNRNDKPDKDITP